MPEYKYLICTKADANNYKYYEMIPNGDSFTVKYGRMGQPGYQTRTYPISQFDKKYSEKIKKGYEDKTELKSEVVEEVTSNNSQSEYKDIENKVIAEIVNRLQKMAKETIAKNYTVNSTTVTQAMIDEAQNILSSLVSIQDVDEFNKNLIQLFNAIPRKMKKVSDYLAKSKEDFSKIITDEQNLLDVMQGQVYVPQHKEKDNAIQTNETILEHFGLEMQETTTEEITMIKNLLAEDANRYVNSWKVINKETQERFDKFVKENNINNIKMLWHGSRSENFWSIIKTGLVLRPTNAIITGKLYGYGIYFAPRARKSIGYTSVNGSYWANGSNKTGFMAIFEVAYGTPYDVYDFDSKYHEMNYNLLQKFKQGANCLHAHAGASMGGYSSLKNDEIVFYKQEQMTIKYLVEIK